MDSAKLSNNQQALRTFDLFCSAGRPQRPVEHIAGPELVEVSGIALLEAFLKQHPALESGKQAILDRLPVRVRVHSEWWLQVRSLAGAKVTDESAAGR
jgi:hypothetical protein